MCVPRAGHRLPNRNREGLDRCEPGMVRVVGATPDRSAGQTPTRQRLVHASMTPLSIAPFRHRSGAARAVLFLFLALSLVTGAFRPGPCATSLGSTPPLRSQHEHEELPHDGADGEKANPGGALLARGIDQRRLFVVRPVAHGPAWAVRVAETPFPSRPRWPADVPLPPPALVTASLGLRAPPPSG